ncbi:MAG: molybdopterin-guanine dinucleotide biosynthesis protein B [Archaeoglobaceae archaeon]
MIILSIVGSSGSGKTTLIEKLVPELAKMGYRVAVVKHAHKGFEVDVKGKDSQRIFDAGADVAVVSEEKVAIFRRISLQDILKFFQDYDIVLLEGFSKLHFPKIALDNREYENVVFRYNGNFEDVLSFITSLLKSDCGGKT